MSTDVPLQLLLPDGPLPCCGGSTTYVQGQRGPMPGTIMVLFQCERCHKTLGDVVPAGPRQPHGTRCWSCGAARSKAGCTDCGLAGDLLDALAAFVRAAPDPAAVARHLCERGYYRTGLAILHCGADMCPDDPRIKAQRDPLLAAAGR